MRTLIISRGMLEEETARLHGMKEGLQILGSENEIAFISGALQALLWLAEDRTPPSEAIAEDGF